MQAFKVRPHPGEVDPNVHLSIDTERIYVIEGAYRLALQNDRELAVLDNAIFGPKVAETLSGLASFHHYKPDVLDTLNSLGRIYSMHRLDATIRSEDDPFNALMWALLEPDSSKRQRDQQRNKAQLGHAKAEEEVIYREALTICWELAQIDPATYLPKVADELKNLKECCGHAEIVLPGFQELLQRYKALAVKQPATYLVLAAETGFELSMFGERTALEREQAESEYRTILASI